ncbi:hypothetical protein ACIRG4_31380 [Streptomyces sp. NPDC102395]|uniref:hypothetical protein n=1 Tax=Streptomyces sp. NPDC102395 TaxID=3366168 RepID=UPI00380D8E96
MAEFSFELDPFTKKGRRGRRGNVGEFGEVIVEAGYRKPSIAAGHRQLEVRLYGDQMPDVLYRTVGPGRPRIKNARLTVSGSPARLSFNSKGIRNSQRALSLTVEGRLYEYVAANLEKGGILTRPGVSVSLRRGKSSTGKGSSSLGTAVGEVDAVDLALAVIFEEVDTLELTTSGAMSDAINRLLNPGRNETATD